MDTTAFFQDEDPVHAQGTRMNAQFGDKYPIKSKPAVGFTLFAG